MRQRTYRHRTRRQSDASKQPAQCDYSRLPDDRVDLDRVFLAVDVNHPAPPGTDFDEAGWVVRHGAT